MKKNNFLILTFLMVIALAVFSWAGQPVLADESVAVVVNADAWNGVDDILVSTQGQKASIPSISIGSNNHLHIGFKQGTDPAYVTSVDAGVTWSAPQVINANANSIVVDTVDIVVGSTGTIYATWVESVGDESYTLFYASKTGASWSAAEAIATSVIAPPFPFAIVINKAALVEHQGSVYVVWARANSGIQFSKRGASGWDVPKEILGTATALSPKIAVDANGKLYVVYSKRGSKNRARYMESADQGANWSGNITISGELDIKNVDLSLSGSNVHAVFGANDSVSGTTGGRPYYTTCTSGCTTAAGWAAPALVSERQISELPVDAPFNATVEVLENGSSIVFYHGATGSDTSAEQVLATCYKAGTGAGTEYNVPTAFLKRMVNAQIVYKNGAVHVVHEKVNGQGATATLREIHYARLDEACADSTPTVTPTPIATSPTIYLPIINR